MGNLTTSGVRQGGPESPNLLNLYLDYIMRIYNHRTRELGIGISFKYRIKDQVRTRGESYRGTGRYLWIGYADDLALTASTQDESQLAADTLSQQLSTYGLVISISKTKTMILNYKGADYPKSIIVINNTPIDNFVYLGALIRYDSPGTTDKELSRRIGMAFSKFSLMKKLLCNYKLRLGIRVRFYEAYVRTRLTYCCET